MTRKPTALGLVAYALLGTLARARAAVEMRSTELGPLSRCGSDGSAPAAFVEPNNAGGLAEVDRSCGPTGLRGWSAWCMRRFAPGQVAVPTVTRKVHDPDLVQA